MYDLVDRPISILPEGNRFLLWAMRAWVVLKGRGDCPPTHLAAAFLKASAIDALPHVHIAMTLLNEGGREALNFHCIHRNTISDGEAVLLRLWGDMAAGNDRAVIAVAELLVTQEWVTPLFSAMQAALPGLDAAGLVPVFRD